MKAKIVLISLILLFSSSTVIAQSQKKLFLRVYTLQEEKIKGNLLILNDSLLVLKRGEQKFIIEAKNIRIIKTKKSGGENILIGVLGGIIVGGIIGYSQGDDEPGWFSYSREDYALAGVLMGAVVGGGIGAITITGKKSKKYIIDGNPESWKVFVEAINPKAILIPE